MPYYEVIYETGEVAVLHCADDEEALLGLQEQHRRAVAGEQNGPQEGRASRVKRVLRYADHPGDYRASGQVDKKDLLAEVKTLVDALEDGANQVNVLQFAEHVKTIVHPMQPVESNHDSRFKVAEEAELELNFI
jgi:hypothetical protein